MGFFRLEKCHHLFLIIMIIKKPVILFFGLSIAFSCTNNSVENIPESTENQEVELSESDKIIAESIRAHGGELYDNAYYSFVFRGNTYSFKNKGSDYEFTKTTQKGDSVIKDVLRNGSFERLINGSLVEVTEKEQGVISEAINSVIYFATLPHKLSDEAVNSELIETIEINGNTYDAIKVTFSKEGGGEDFEDEYFYWINQSTKKVDYLAYNYLVNGGGVRFRSAYNARVVNGITFQDYINYKAETGTPLQELPSLLELGKLTEISRIETEEVVAWANE